jgi:hypothetical protein
VQEEQVLVLKLRIDGTPAKVVPIDMGTSKPLGDIKASLQLPTSGLKPGKYKMWRQFNRGGKIVIADFWVNVS